MEIRMLMAFTMTRAKEHGFWGEGGMLFIAPPLTSSALQAYVAWNHMNSHKDRLFHCFQCF